jgi:hypothetical protein
METKIFELRFSYYDISERDDAERTEGTFSILCRAPTKDSAVAIAGERLRSAAISPGKFLSEIGELVVDLDWIFEIDDVKRPVIIGHVEHIGMAPYVAASEDGRLEDAGIELHYYEDPNHVAPATGILKGSTSSFFWRRPPGDIGSRPPMKNAPAPAEVPRDQRAVQVLREPTGKHDRAVPVSRAHKQKYKTLIQGLEDAKKKNAGLLLIAAPWVLGDDYKELVANMNLVAKANLKLCIGTLDTEPDPEDVESFPKFSN